MWDYITLYISNEEHSEEYNRQFTEQYENARKASKIYLTNKYKIETQWLLYLTEMDSTREYLTDFLLSKEIKEIENDVVYDVVIISKSVLKNNSGKTEKSLQFEYERGKEQYLSENGLKVKITSDYANKETSSNYVKSLI